jgi:hypothetical protein
MCMYQCYLELYTPILFEGDIEQFCGELWYWYNVLRSTAFQDQYYVLLYSSTVTG